MKHGEGLNFDKLKEICLESGDSYLFVVFELYVIVFFKWISENGMVRFRLSCVYVYLVL